MAINIHPREVRNLGFQDIALKHIVINFYQDLGELKLNIYLEVIIFEHSLKQQFNDDDDDDDDIFSKFGSMERDLQWSTIAYANGWHEFLSMLDTSSVIASANGWHDLQKLNISYPNPLSH
ncbi:unnamed protein product [Vicia faba]|uniref:Uncharacterized protein n=1 Tax=Vicia faba TaxID=3906 RepID=A0AAV0YQE6_VICFA|nr:unnamed protein product [Vicia faba]